MVLEESPDSPVCVTLAGTSVRTVPLENVDLTDHSLSALCTKIKVELVVIPYCMCIKSIAMPQHSPLSCKLF